MKRYDVSAIISVWVLIALIVGGCATDAFYYNRGLAYQKKGQYDQAIFEYNRAIEINPRYAEAYNNRGSAYIDKGQYDMAISDFNKAIEINPKLTQVYYNRGTAWAYKGDYDRAIADFNKALEINPFLSLPYSGRGTVWSNKGDYDQAIADFTKALEIDPKNYDAKNGIAWLLATCPDARYRDGAKAMQLAQKLVEVCPKAFCFDTLAAAYAEAGNFDDAITTQEKAIALLKKEGDPKNLIDKFIERLNFYKDHMPWRKR